MNKKNKKTSFHSHSKIAIPATSKINNWYCIAIVVVLTLILYIPSFNNQFTNWDDDLYVTSNKSIQSLSYENITSFFTEFKNGNYHPLTFLSLAIDYHFSELNPTSYHITNFLLHLFNTLFVFLFIFLLTEKSELAFITSVLFGIHTMHVESVAWISERKDVLYTFFFLLSLISYIYYIKKKKYIYLVSSLLLFILSCFSKGQAVSLALSVIVIDFFFNRKIKNKSVALEKVLFLIIALLFGIIAIYAQKSAEAIFDNASRSYLDRILFASYGFMNYLIKLIYPYNLSAIYPYPSKGKIGIEYWMSLFASLILCFVTWKNYKQNKQVIFGVLFFLFNIILVLQLLPVGNVIMADRYSYIPSIGFFFLAALFILFLKEKKNISPSLLFILFSGYILFISYQSYKRVDVWESSLSLWNDVIEKQPTSEVAWNNRGSVKNNDNNFEEAISDYNQAIQLNPLYADAYSNRGMSKKNAGDYIGAIKDLDQSLLLKPNYAFSYSTKGIALTYLNKLDDAMICFNKAIELNPYASDAYSGRGVVKTKLKDIDGALIDLNLALHINPNHAETISNRGIAFAEGGNFQKSLEDFNLGIRLKPQHSGSYMNRGMLYLKMNQKKEACNDFNMAQQLGSRAAIKAIEQFCK